jgi:hypothetical protein
MPEAAGAVAAAAVADRLLGPREHRRLAIILVQFFQLFEEHFCLLKQENIFL